MITKIEQVTKQVGAPQVISVARTSRGMLATLNLGITSTEVEKSETNPDGLEYACTQVNVSGTSELTLKDCARLMMESTGTIIESELKQIAQLLGVTDYGTIVSAVVRSRYSEDDVEAIMLNGKDNAEHKAEYAALQQWRTQAKEIAKAVLAE